MKPTLCVVTLLLALGCAPTVPPPEPEVAEEQPTLSQARMGHRTYIISELESFPVDVPPTDGPFELITYPSPVGDLAAYITRNPEDGEKHPAIVWITGGDSNSIGDVWSPQPRENDQSARAFRDAGIVMMFPSQRGGNENPGQREGFLGEVDDILAATDYLSELEYVDADRIYLGGHSTGGTTAILVAECSDRYQAVFSFGPVATPMQYDGQFVYADIQHREEMILRSPIYWLDSVTTPLLVFEGALEGNWPAIQMMVEANQNPKIEFFRVPGYDHFSVIAPVTELLAKQIVAGNVNVTEEDLLELLPEEETE